MLSDGDFGLVEVEILGDEYYLRVLYCVFVYIECRVKDKFVFYIEEFKLLIVVEDMDLFVVLVVGIEGFFINIRFFDLFEEFL